MKTISVTPADLEAEVKKVQYYVFPDTTTTVCQIVMQNGFSVLGQSACIDPYNFNEKLGQELAYKDAYSKMWAFLGFRGRDRMYDEEHGPDLPGEEA